jgi:hypothetical protein
MRKRRLAAAVQACGLVGGVVTLAQGPAELPPPPVEQGPLPAADPPRPLPREAGVGRPQEDPMQTVEAFVLRGRKEAEGAIDTLAKEAETLRARLLKVEAALERWKMVEGALKGEASVPSHELSPQLESIPGAVAPRSSAVPRSESIPKVDRPASSRWKGAADVAKPARSGGPAEATPGPLLPPAEADRK